MLQIPNYRHVRQIELHRFRADEPHKLDACFFAQLFETRLSLTLLEQRIESTFSSRKNAFAEASREIHGLKARVRRELIDTFARRQKMTNE